MKKHSLLLVFVAAVSALILTASVVVVASAGGQDDPGVVAQESVARFAKRRVGLRQLPVSEQEQQGHLSKWADVETGDEYTIDARGVIKTMADKHAMNAVAPVTKRSLTVASLADRAKTHVAAHFPTMALEKMRVSTKYYTVGTASDGQQQDLAQVELREYLGSIPTCNVVILQMNPETGAVLIVNHDEGPLDVPTQPEIASGAAIDKTAAAVSMPVHPNQSAELQVWRDPQTGRAHLVWQVTLRTGDSEFGATGLGTVDAVDGSLLVHAVVGQ